MATINVGDSFTTRVSHLTGIVKEIHPRSYGTVLLLDVNGDYRYTTV